jgi:DNA-binding transcriptional LysR family regulator
MALNLHHLRVFAAVAQHGGFSRAASALRVSQPAVSKVVRELERQVGMPLLDRSGRAPRLTPAGELLFARSRELFGVERAAEEELRALRGLERGTLRVGASTTIATYLLPPLLASFRAAYPAIALRVASANTRAVARLLLERRPWRRDELVVIASPAHPLVKRRRLRASALADEVLIARERGSGTREVAERALLERGVRPRYAMQLGSTEAIKQAVAAGLGLAIVSRATAADQVALGRLIVVPMADLRIERTLAELRVRGRALTGAAAAFAAW